MILSPKSTFPIPYLQKVSYLRYVPLILSFSTHNCIGEPHWHDYTQIWYTISGSYLHTINGSVIKQQPGSVSIIPPYSIHTIDTSMSDMEQTKIVSLSFSNHAINTFSIPYFQFNHNTVMFDNFKLDTSLWLEPKNKAAADEIIFNIVSALLTLPVPDFSSAFKNLCAFLELCAKTVNRKMPVFDLSSSTEKLHCINNITDYMASNPNKGISLSDASKSVAMSTRSFTQVFKEITGQTFHTYNTYLRMMKALQYLSSDRLSISEIADECGFSDSSHFNRVCKALQGTSPHILRSYLCERNMTYQSILNERNRLNRSLNQYGHDLFHGLLSSDCIRNIK